MVIFITVKNNWIKRAGLLAVVPLVTDAGTLRTAAQGPGETTRAALKYVL